MFKNFDLANLIELGLFSITMLITALSSYYNGRQTDKMRIQLNEFENKMLDKISLQYLRRDFVDLYEAKHNALEKRVDIHDEEIAEIRTKCDDRLDIHRKLAEK